MSSADTSGVVRLLGSLSTAFQPRSSALFTTFVPATEKYASNAFLSNDESALGGVNLAGEAAGLAYYAPAGGFFTPNPEFVLPPGRWIMPPAKR
jgi:hypothetical protein